MKKLYRIISILLLAVLTLSCLPVVSAASEKAVKIESLQTEGFTVENFSGDTNYYLCYPESFEGIKFTKIEPNINADITISVERYCDSDYPLSFNENEPLYLGYGRARITVTLTSKKDPKNTISYLFALTDPKQDTYSYRFFTTATPVYQTAKESSKTLIGTIKKGTTSSSMPLCIGTKGDWTQIVIPTSSTAHHGKIGWVKTKNLVEEYDETPLPYSYESQIKALKKAHPNWTFEYRHMNIDFSEYVNVVAGQPISNTTDGETTSKKYIEYYMNPKNFLNEKNVFMFLDLTKYNNDDYTVKGVSSVWTEKSGSVCTKEEAIKYITSAGNSLKMNTYFITSRGAIESKYGTSPLAKGTYGIDEKKPENHTKLFYNFYGIGATDNDPANGGRYAEKREWDTPYRSIVEGANWINDQYIQRGQNTPYFFRFYPYRTHHIYMSDLSAPKTESALLYKAYKGAGKLDSKLHFIIPVYDGFVYNDVSEKAWYYEDVYRATGYGLFTGMGNGDFKPEELLTRAQFVTVLAKMSGADVSEYKNTKFQDVAPKSWYEKYVAWGYETGVSMGISETKFEPDRPISRQELCTMLVRFADTNQFTMKQGELKFTDKADIAKWARTGVRKCVGEKLVSGMPDGTFAPLESATRAQGARILSLFYEIYGLTKK